MSDFNAQKRPSRKSGAEVEAGEPLGLTLVGRGFHVRVGVPFSGSLADALSKVAAQCVAACPTAALSFKDDKLCSELPILGQA